jgi:hypothetical protein
MAFFSRRVTPISPTRWQDGLTARVAPKPRLRVVFCQRTSCFCVTRSSFHHSPRRSVPLVRTEEPLRCSPRTRRREVLRFADLASLPVGAAAKQALRQSDSMAGARSRIRTGVFRVVRKRALPSQVGALVTLLCILELAPPGRLLVFGLRPRAQRADCCLRQRAASRGQVRGTAHRGAAPVGCHGSPQGSRVHLPLLSHRHHSASAPLVRSLVGHYRLGSSQAFRRTAKGGMVGVPTEAGATSLISSPRKDRWPSSAFGIRRSEQPPGGSYSSSSPPSPTYPHFGPDGSGTTTSMSPQTDFLLHQTACGGSGSRPTPPRNTFHLCTRCSAWNTHSGNSIRSAIT